MLLCLCIKSRADALANLPVPGQGGFRESGMWPLRQLNGDATRQPSSVRTDGGFLMSANIVRLLPDQEQALLACYVTGTKQPASFQQLFDTMEVPTNAEPDRLQIAVAQILLHHVQDRLPQWAAITSDGELVTNRRRHARHKDARLQFNPRLLFEINWATSGPGYEWPEAYHVTSVPGFEKYISTASRDGDAARIRQSALLTR